jgi:hypothetical protein
MLDPRLADDSYLWVTPHLADAERAAREAQNLASLRRKVTYCLARPEVPVQFQHVEGWTTGHIVGYMRGLGLSIARIRRDLAAAVYEEPSDAAV